MQWKKLYKSVLNHFNGIPLNQATGGILSLNWTDTAKDSQVTRAFFYSIEVKCRLFYYKLSLFYANVLNSSMANANKYQENNGRPNVPLKSYIVKCTSNPIYLSILYRKSKILCSLNFKTYPFWQKQTYIFLDFFKLYFAYFLYM